ncbi:hypothetical protein OJAV_G00086280 [Oryzias javanicus]|uniref:Uncharacterized protein n=1 Tax=Oryzias javanicus TaxID=123683 RepID=A0A3S2MVM3_ORYJA|nr:hypothetical protein OJAV_G00086280 [Oryzias javanicus]
MRHIHVELAHKKAPLELPAQEGDLPPTAAPTNGLDPGMGGFSTTAGSYSDAQQRQQRKRGAEEPQLTHKRSHLDDSSDGPALEGGCCVAQLQLSGLGLG